MKPPPEAIPKMRKRTDWKGAQDAAIAGAHDGDVILIRIGDQHIVAMACKADRVFSHSLVSTLPSLRLSFVVVASVVHYPDASSRQSYTCRLGAAHRKGAENHAIACA